jgi:N-acetyl-anhydromuramyl-L-alanine amidase AmpD
VQRISPNKQAGRDGWKPDIIVCHITEGAFDGAVSWLCHPQSGVSAHFVVGQDGQITQLVSIEDTAWCNGTSPDPAQTTYSGNSTLKTVRDRKINANLYTISIEHEGIWATTKGKLTVRQLGASVDLIQWIRSEAERIYKVVIPLDREHIVGHYQINPINKPNCPGALFQFDTILKILQGRELVQPAVTIADVRNWNADEGIIGLAAKGDAPVTYDVLRWAFYKLEHRKV